MSMAQPDSGNGVVGVEKQTTTSVSAAAAIADDDDQPQQQHGAADDPEGTTSAPAAGQQQIMSDEALYAIEVKEQDRWLPIANVARIMKTALPENAKIAKEAKECMQECVSEFISFITSEASEKCQQEKRKTVNGEDILFAMTSLGFENYSEALKIYLARYRLTNTSKSESAAKAGSGEARASADANSATPQATDGEVAPEEDGSAGKADGEEAVSAGETTGPAAFTVGADSNNFASAPFPTANGDEANYNGSYNE